MKQLLKRTLQHLAETCTAAQHEAVMRSVEETRHTVNQLASRPQMLAKEAQVLLKLRYENIRRRGLPVPSFSDVGFRCHSQFEEDGILLLIFGLLGAYNRTVVEVCAGNGIESMSANLI